ncbi:MAG: phage protease [Planctomycetota bacterium]
MTARERERLVEAHGRALLAGNWKRARAIERRLDPQAAREARAESMHAPCTGGAGDAQAANGATLAQCQRACNGVAIEADDGVPDWIMVARAGTWHGRPTVGDVTVQTIGPEDLRAASQFFQDHQAPTGIPVDVGHASILTPTDAPAAGWITDVELRAGGTELWGRVAWTERAANAVAAREYRRLSPVLVWGRPDPKTGEPVPLTVHSVALTNTPHMADLAALNAAAAAGETPEAGATDGPGDEPDPEEGGRTMQTLLEQLAEAWGLDVEAAAGRLGVAPDADDEAVAAAITPAETDGEPTETPPVSEAVANALGVAADADEATVLETLQALKAPAEPEVDLALVANACGLEPDATELDVLKAIKAMQSGRQADEAEVLVANAVRAGKIPPALRERYLRLARTDLEGTRDLLGDLDDRTRPDVTVNAHGGGGGGPKLTEAEAHVARLLGLSDEDMLAARG